MWFPSETRPIVPVIELKIDPSSETQPSKAWGQSLDWFKEKITGTPHLSWGKPWFPVSISRLNQSSEWRVKLILAGFFSLRPRILMKKGSIWSKTHGENGKTRRYPTFNVCFHTIFIFFNIGYPTFNGLSMCPIQIIIYGLVYGYMTSKKIEDVSRKHSYISWCFCSFLGAFISINIINMVCVYIYIHILSLKKVTKYWWSWTMRPQKLVAQNPISAGPSYGWFSSKCRLS